MGVQQQLWRKSCRANNSGPLSYSGMNQSGFVLVIFLIFITHQTGGHVLLWAVAGRKKNKLPNQAWAKVKTDDLLWILHAQGSCVIQQKLAFCILLSKTLCFPGKALFQEELSHISCVWGQPWPNNPRTHQDYPPSGIPGQVLISLIASWAVLQPLLNSADPVAFPEILAQGLWALSQKLFKRHQACRCI